MALLLPLSWTSPNHTSRPLTPCLKTPWDRAFSSAAPDQRNYLWYHTCPLIIKVLISWLMALLYQFVLKYFCLHCMVHCFFQLFPDVFSQSGLLFGGIKDYTTPLLPGIMNGTVATTTSPSLDIFCLVELLYCMNKPMSSLHSTLVWFSLRARGVTLVSD